MGYEPGLIRYTTEHALTRKLDQKAMWARVFRLRTLIYSGILSLIILATAVSLFNHVPLKVDVIRDRTMPKITEMGAIENVYRLQVMNTQESARRYSVDIIGLPGATILNNPVVEVKSANATAVPIRVRVPANLLQPGSNRIRFEIKDLDAPKVKVIEKAVFLVPR